MRHRSDEKKKCENRVLIYQQWAIIIHIFSSIIGVLLAI